MSDYVIFTDSACDLSVETLKEWGVGYGDLTVCFEGQDKIYANGEISPKEFYERMRAGEHPKTSAVNLQGFIDVFEPVLAEGKDVLYVGVSSGISTTFNSARMAAQELAEKYPERKLLLVDTLAASAGVALIVYLALEKKKAGASIEENAEYLDSLTEKHCIWFTVDDLEYLKRGGRVSPAVALVGGLLGVKPVLKMDDEGVLVKVGTVRGRKKSLEALADKFAELASDKTTPVFISHADSEEDAATLGEMLKARGAKEVTLVTEIGPIIGSHAGPGTIAVFFLGDHR